MNTTEISDFYRRFCRETFDDRGLPQTFEPVYADGFNFAYDVVDQIALREPGRLAMVWCNEAGLERTFTFADMKQLSDQAANLFHAHGVCRGDMVLLALGRRYQFWPAVLALHKIGAVAINSGSRLTAKDLLYRFTAADVKYIVCANNGDAPHFADVACECCDTVEGRFLVGGRREGWIDFDGELAAQPRDWERVETRADDPLVLYFTSGTEGNPKMAWHDHTYPLAHIFPARHWHGITPDSLHMTVADTGWAKASWGKLYGPWFLGAAIFVYDFDRFNARRLLEAVCRHGVTSFCAPSTVYRFLLREDLKQFDLSRIAHAATSGEALSTGVFRRFYEATGLQIREAFGQSETAAIVLNPIGAELRPGSMGRPSPLYHVDLVDGEGESVQPGEIGELVLRIPDGRRQVGLFRGYYREDEKTAEVRHDGLYHTGDTAWRDHEGYLWYVSRIDDVIKASGYRIGPFEIESVLQAHPAVAECAVTGAPDPVRGTVVKATVVLSRGFAPSEALRLELQQHVRQQTAPYKYPRIVEFVAELPRTPSGKVKRADIRREDESAVQSQDFPHGQGA